MRSIRLLAVATGALVLGTACGDGGGTPPPDNRAPVAGFTEVCTELSCVFTDASTDADGNETITGWAWTFGDNTTANVKSPPAHAYATAGIKVVTLTVTDNAGATSTPPFSKNVTVGAAANVPPTASFTVNDCAGGTCVFTSTSTDADGTVAGYAWNFGEPASATNTSAEQHPTHTYAAVAQATPFTVTLTVTDDDGAASNVATQTVTIQPPASQLCTASGKTADCTLNITAQARVTITLTSNDCHLGGSRFDIISPIQQNIFFNGCLASQNGTSDVLNGPNPDKSFNAGTVILTRFTRGEVFDPANDPVPGVPQITLEGSYPNWTMRIDDGGAPALPRNDDLVLTITATPITATP